MLDDLAAAVEDFGPRLQALGHAIQHRLAFQPRDFSEIVRAPRAKRTGGTRGAIGVIDFPHIAQLAFIARRKKLPGRADIGVPFGVVAKLVLAEESLARRRPALGPGHMRRQPRLLAGLDVLGSEIALVGDDIDSFDIEDGAGGFGGLLQQAHVDHLVGHLLRDDHLVLRVDGDLNIIADSHARVRRHGSAVGIGEGYLAFAAPLQLRQQRPVAAALLAQRFDFFRQILRARAARSRFPGVAFVKPLEIIIQSFVGSLDEFASTNSA
jgi:hypothetical protein